MLRNTLILILAMAALSSTISAITLDDVVAKAIEARGGLEAMQAVNTVRIAGTIHNPNRGDHPGNDGDSGLR